MAKDREFGVYNWALFFPGIPAIGRSGGAQAVREMIGRAIGPLARRPAVARGRGDVEEAKSLKNPLCF